MWKSGSSHTHKSRTLNGERGEPCRFGTDFLVPGVSKPMRQPDSPSTTRQEFCSVFSPLPDDVSPRLTELTGIHLEFDAPEFV